MSLQKKIEHLETQLSRMTTCAADLQKCLMLCNEIAGFRVSTDDIQQLKMNCEHLEKIESLTRKYMQSLESVVIQGIEENTAIQKELSS